MQYAKAFTDALQFMWGEGFLSPGGPEEVADMLAGRDITGWRVLDVGSGLGGVDVVLVERHRAGSVVGIDVEAQLVDAARELSVSKGMGDRLQFLLVEPGPLPFPDQSFDLVFSKDAMVHVADKAFFFREGIRVLKPGGALVVADWLWAEDAATSPVVVDWLSKGPLKFAFTTIAEAREAMEKAGFRDIAIEERRELLQASNREEVRTLEGPARQRLAQLVGDEMADNRLRSARGRQAALDSGDLIPSHMKGRRPASG